VREEGVGFYELPAHLDLEAGGAESAEKSAEAGAPVAGGRFLARRGVQTLSTQAGSRWGNGCMESSSGALRDEMLDRETFHTLQEARVLI
jgi:hypothetical protein